jgi:parallel beta-helix repeat protein
MGRLHVATTRFGASAVLVAALAAVAVAFAAFLTEAGTAKGSVVRASLAGAPPCNAVAVPENASGAPSGAVRGVESLVRRLQPGQIGCLMPGVYREDVSIHSSGTRLKPITITSAQGGVATILGLVSVPHDTHDVTIARLKLDGSVTDGAPSPQINGANITLRRNEITNANTAICVILGGGFARYGMATNTLVDRNRIHHCGRLPATRHDHGIYVEGSEHAKITNNVIYKNADWGIQLYPNADDTLVENNVIADNGSGGIIIASTSGEDEDTPSASDRNMVVGNIVSGSTNGYGIESYWGGSEGVGNVVMSNCLWANHEGAFGNTRGLKLRRNFSGLPRFIGGSYLLAAASECRRVTSGPKP